MALIQQFRTIKTGITVLDGTYPAERNHQNWNHCSWWHLSSRKEPSKLESLFLVALIQQKGTIKTVITVLGGTYPAERNHQNCNLCSWWHLSSSLEPPKLISVSLVALIQQKGTIKTGILLLDGTYQEEKNHQT
ncbi:hypothetical protein [Metabacillus indicus]|uniref:hypothetical protein n=1 Tax=Metabacillus indicus TaxID=246786 RepID=UPI00126873B3|nr:hypothetical protein [Metabacillus indicus]